MGVVRRIGVAAGAVFLAIALCYPLLAVEGSMSGAAHCFDAACGAAIDSLIIDEPCGCTKADYAVEYTPCNTTSDTRSAVHFWRPPATCRGGATPDLPEPIHDIPCGLVCGPGLHLFQSSEGWFGCQVCEAGTFFFFSPFLIVADASVIAIIHLYTHHITHHLTHHTTHHITRNVHQKARLRRGAACCLSGRGGWSRRS